MGNHRPVIYNKGIADVSILNAYLVKLAINAGIDWDNHALHVI